MILTIMLISIITDCGCYRSGTLGGSNVCGNNGGQCMCRTYTTGRTCDTCTAGTYNLEDYHYYGCQGEI